jgi:hypothetical protein
MEARFDCFGAHSFDDKRELEHELEKDWSCMFPLSPAVYRASVLCQTTLNKRKGVDGT